MPNSADSAFVPVHQCRVATSVVSVLRTAPLITEAETDYTVAVPLEGLTPSARYRYHVLVGRAESVARQLPETPTVTGEFVTLPDERTSAAVSFAWSGDLGSGGRCRRGVDGYPIFDVIPRYHPDFFLFLGDTIYGDHLCPSPPNEPGADFKATQRWMPIGYAIATNGVPPHYSGSWRRRRCMSSGMIMRFAIILRVRMTIKCLDWMSPAFIQPVASDDVVAAMADLLVGEPVNTIVEIAGPEKFRLDELVRKYVAVMNDEHEVITDIHAPYFGVELKDSSLIPGKGSRIGTVRYEDWISQPVNQRLFK